MQRRRGSIQPSVPLGTPVPYRIKQSSKHQYDTKLRTLVQTASKSPRRRICSTKVMKHLGHSIFVVHSSLSHKVSRSS